MHDIFDRLTSLGKRLDVSIFFFGHITPEWRVKLTWQSDHPASSFNPATSITVERTNASFDRALTDAWNEFEQVVTRGMGAAALLPPIEARAEAVEGPGVTLAQTFDDTKH